MARRGSLEESKYLKPDFKDWRRSRHYRLETGSIKIVIFFQISEIVIKEMTLLPISDIFISNKRDQE